MPTSLKHRTPPATSRPETKPAVLPELSTNGVAPMKASMASVHATRSQLSRWL